MKKRLSPRLIAVLLLTALLASCGEGTTAVDTTAAGDTFTGYFFTELLSGADPESALRIASAASAIAVSRAGASPSIPTKDEVLAFLKNK